MTNTVSDLQLVLDELVQSVFRAQPSPSRHMHWRNVSPRLSPQRILQHLRHSVLSDLLLEPGASLSCTEESSELPDLGLHATDDALTAVVLQFWRWPQGDATREISIILEYHGGEAKVRFTARADKAGSSVLERRVWASQYLTHPGKYSGHNTMYRDAVPAYQIRQFCHLLEKLMD